MAHVVDYRRLKAGNGTHYKLHYFTKWRLINKEGGMETSKPGSCQKAHVRTLTRSVGRPGCCVTWCSSCPSDLSCCCRPSSAGPATTSASEDWREANVNKKRQRKSQASLTVGKRYHSYSEHVCLEWTILKGLESVGQTDNQGNRFMESVTE